MPEAQVLPSSQELPSANSDPLLRQAARLKNPPSKQIPLPAPQASRALLGKSRPTDRNKMTAPQTSKDFTVDNLGEIIYLESVDKQSKKLSIQDLKPFVIEVKDMPSFQSRVEMPAEPKQPDPLPEFVKAEIQVLSSLMSDVSVAPGVTLTERGRSVKGPEFDKAGRYCKNDLFNVCK